MKHNKVGLVLTAVASFFISGSVSASELDLNTSDVNMDTYIEALTSCEMEPVTVTFPAFKKAHELNELTVTKNVTVRCKNIRKGMGISLTFPKGSMKHSDVFKDIKIMEYKKDIDIAGTTVTQAINVGVIQDKDHESYVARKSYSSALLEDTIVFPVQFYAATTDISKVQYALLNNGVTKINTKIKMPMTIRADGI